MNPNTDYSVITDTQESHSFTGENFDDLAKGNLSRYYPSSARVAHAVIHENANGEKIVWQFHLPKGKNICQKVRKEKPRKSSS